MARARYAPTPMATTPTDLFELTASNADQLARRLRELQAATDIADFVSCVTDRARVSCNAWSTKVVPLLRDNRYPTPYELARERSEREGGDPEDHLRAHQQEYYARRVGFDRSFQDGEQFRYGALNVGNLGAYEYGAYCIVLRPPTAEARVALLPDNSLERYIDPASCKVYASRIADEGGPWRCRAHIAALKHGTAAAATGPDNWPDLLCGRGKQGPFIEVILGDPIDRARVEALRMSRAREEHFEAVTADALLGLAAPNDLADLAGHNEVLAALREVELQHLYTVV